MSEQAPHMTKQVIHYSDGSEKVINYRGVIVDGVLTLDEVNEPVAEESAPAPVVKEAVEAPLSEEVIADAPAEAPASEEVPLNS